jgi:hypothetical protein
MSSGLKRFWIAVGVSVAYQIGVHNERASPGDHSPWSASEADWLALCALVALLFLLMRILSSKEES